MAALRLLVVDADPIACAGWRSVLDEQAWVERCEATSSLAECLAFASALEPHIAVVGLVLSDNQHGLDVCRRLREGNPELRVMVVCDADALPVRAARAAGASGLIHRAWSLDQTLSVVQRVAAGETVLAASPVRAAGSTRLSRRELSVIRMVANGASNPEIAAALHLSHHTVKEYTQVVFRKLGVRNRAEAATTAARLGYAD